MKNISVHRNQKIKSFLFFLALALGIWFLTKFSKDLTTELTLSVVYKNLPEETLLGKAALQEFTVGVKANGFKLMGHSLGRKQIVIDASAGNRINQSTLRFNQDQLLAFCYRQLPNVGVLSLDLQELLIPLDQMASKLVPVVFKGDVVLKQGFRAVSELTITPQQIKLFGPQNSIELIDSITTELMTISGLDEDLDQLLALELPENNEITLSSKQVQVIMEVEEFAQKKLVLPVEMLNVPRGTELKIFPESMTVQFEVSVAQFNQVVPASFKLVCDFSEKITEDSFMIPKLVIKPNGIIKTELSHKKVDYVIFKD